MKDEIVADESSLFVFVVMMMDLDAFAAAVVDALVGDFYDLMTVDVNSDWCFVVVA